MDVFLPYHNWGASSREFTQRKSYLNQTDPLCTVAKFKLAVFTVPAHTLACALTCDPYQPNKFKGYLRVFIYVGTGYLIHHFHAKKKTFRTTSRRLRIDTYTIGEGPSLK